MTRQKSIQEYYEPAYSHCYGCGTLNLAGLRLHSFWTGAEAVARFQPAAFHVALPGFVYGGLLASLADCHAMATAVAASWTAGGSLHQGEHPQRFVTGSLDVRYLRPTGLGQVLEIHGRALEISSRKVLVGVSIRAAGQETVAARIVAVRAPASMTGAAGGAAGG